MTIVERVDAMLKEAMRAHDRGTADALRMIKSVLQAELYGTTAAGVIDERVVAALRAYRRRLHEDLGVYHEAGSRGEEHADQLVLEIALCDRLLDPDRG